MQEAENKFVIPVIDDPLPPSRRGFGCDPGNCEQGITAGSRVESRRVLRRAQIREILGSCGVCENRFVLTCRKMENSEAGDPH